MPGNKPTEPSLTIRKSTRIQEKSASCPTSPSQSNVTTRPKSPLPPPEVTAGSECVTPSSSEQDVNTISIHSKLDNITKLLEGVISRLDVMENKVQNLEKGAAVTTEKMEKMEESLEFAMSEIEEMKCGKKEGYERDLKSLEKRCDDLESRSKRNNLVFWGVPEGIEDTYESCSDFISYILQDVMEIENGKEIEIERAHRSPAGRLAKAQRGNAQRPRPIHVAFLRFRARDYILRSAASLKDKAIKGNRVFITDDVAKCVRDDRKKLVPVKNQLREKGHYAIIPFSVPAYVLYKNNEGVYKKIYAADTEKTQAVE